MELSLNASVKPNKTAVPGSSEGSVKTFLVSLAINATIAIIVLLLYSRLRPKLKHIYSPRLLLLDGRFPLGKLPHYALAWVIPAFMAKDEDVFEYAGIDALVYLRFLKLCVKISFVILPYGLAVLLPLNHYGGVDLSGLSQLSMSNLKEDSPKMWAHFVAVWVYTFVICYLLYEEWRVFIVYRQEYLSKGLHHQYAVLVRDLPLKLCNEESMRSYVENVFPGQAEDVEVVRDLRRWEKMILKHNKLVRKLEKAKFILQRTGERPTNGERDSILYYEKKLQKLQMELEDELNKQHKALPCSFVIFKSLRNATESLLKSSPFRKRTNPCPAPSPADVIWDNLVLNQARRSLRTLVVSFIVLLTVLFYFIPVAFVSSLVALQNLKDSIPFLSNVDKLPGLVTGLIEGFLSSLALLLFFAILPMAMRYLSKKQGFISMSTVEISSLEKLFIFKIINQFIFLAAGSALKRLKEMLKHPDDIPRFLGTTLPSQSTFFISFLMLCAFTVYPFELLRLVPLVLVYFKKKFFNLTPREEKENWRPPAAPYDALFADHLLILIIGLCYSIMAPIVTPFVLLYFGFGYVVWMYQLMCVYIPTYSSGGLMWPVVFKRITICVIVFHLVMIGIFSLKKIVVIPSLLVPLPVITLVFSIFMSRYFSHSYTFLSQEISDELPEATPNVLQCVTQSYIRNDKLPLEYGLSTDGSHTDLPGYEEITGPTERSPLISPVVIQSDHLDHDDHFQI